MDSQKTRSAYHAGSWYTDDGQKLNQQLTTWLENAQFELSNISTVKAIIGPHAGYRYSGPTAGWAYKYFKNAPKDPLRVFLLGPSHHVYLDGCGLSDLKFYETPLGDIELDRETIEALKKEGHWEILDKDTEEQEHSLEMHLPYIRKAFEGRNIKLVPIMVGQVDTKAQEYYGALLAKYFDDENTVFCVSSDFCHWGKRFKFQYYKKEDGAIHESIEKLDRRGMELIEAHNFKYHNSIQFLIRRGFTEYLQETSNTICGRRPIGILLNVFAKSKYSQKLKTKFVRYAQSEAVMTPDQSSVSYASAVTYLS